KRADIGISYVFTDANINISSSSMFKSFKYVSLGFEIYNMFDVKNAITNTWVRDAYSKQYYSIPNYMTARVFNVKLRAKL
ncbi:MAG TPA: hypothetical protein VJ970_07820, partial [Flavobacteriaceae bacterium]|nr:hypothetical protein [Flavobacteriaceae bacterium]